MALSSLFSPSFNSIPFTNPTNRHLCNYHHHLHSSCFQFSSKKREFPPPSVASIPYQPINVDYLEEEFSGHGVTFEGLGDSCVAKMTVENGSSVTLMLPSGFNHILQGSHVAWSTWALQDIRGDSRDTIQVEMVSTDAKDMVEISTPEATFAYGLEGSDFFNRPVFLSNFGIVPPGLSQNRGFGSGQMWENLGLKGFFTGWDARNQKNGDEGKDSLTESEEMEGEENENYKNLTEAMSRIYTSAPRDFTIIDRGRRNSVVVGREGFEELYIFSPGSRHESYGMYSFICVGQSAMLRPVTLNPGDAWTGSQHLHNPNI
ncbi:APOSPORY-ASSOCIATED PROTEIN C-RELATED [Salix koriyanagi]|uniref:APOSPORY-ASSOCIATED PROTEIN C-RELATED n=1 Tax=Salix koriyanagi TaxID=2511006 RepID=A0A9Q1A819_9ROSI|nr:APOSPORY-ASSOCIATED PROTEIN C-RELATED [Salix koriyanagi]